MFSYTKRLFEGSLLVVVGGAGGGVLVSPQPSMEMN